LLADLPRFCLGDVGLLLDLGRLGATQVLQVGAVSVRDVLDGERVQDEALDRQRSLSGFGDLGRERATVLDDLLD
jgi:hypothetical protein